MYGLPQKVANVTANGEEIINVAEYGPSISCEYFYDNDKQVLINNEENTIFISLKKGEGLCFGSTEGNAEHNYEGYVTEAEKEILIKDAKERYRRDHIKCKKSSFFINKK